MPVNFGFLEIEKKINIQPGKKNKKFVGSEIKLQAHLY
jgi:hypothetical protein